MSAPELWDARIDRYVSYRGTAGFNVLGDAPSPSLSVLTHFPGFITRKPAWMLGLS
jgi:hypothetical protein